MLGPEELVWHSLYNTASLWFVPPDKVVPFGSKWNDEYAGACWLKKADDKESLAFTDTFHNQEEAIWPHNIQITLLMYDNVC